MITVVGHRGAAGIAPENTLFGLEKAVELGVDMVEFDVRQTADESLVLMHDETVDRTTDGTGPVAELTLDEIRALDAGEGHLVPTLDEALETLAELDVGAYIELKEGDIANRVVDKARPYGVLEHSEVTAWDPAVIREIADRDAPVGGPLATVDEEHLRVAQELGYRHIGVHHESITREIVSRIQSVEIAAGAWPVNTREDLERVRSLGVDAVTTDRPDIIIAALEDDSPPS